MESIAHVLASRSVTQSLSRHSVKTADLQKIAQFWQVPSSKTLEHVALLAEVQKAFENRALAQKIVAGLTPVEKQVLEAYRRFGNGLVSGAVMRMDLMARGLLRIRRQIRGDRYHIPEWETDPTVRLRERGCLLIATASIAGDPLGHSGFGPKTEHPLPPMILNPALVDALSPAGPPPWQAESIEQAESSGKPRSSAEVAFELAQVLATVTVQKTLRINRSGQVSTPLRQALLKALPFPDDLDFPFPDRQVFGFELLSEVGVVKVNYDRATVDPSTAHSLFGMSTLQQGRMWAAAWLRAECWSDGLGSTNPEIIDSYFTVETKLAARRQILAWALAGIAHQGARWFDLASFILRIKRDAGSAALSPYMTIYMPRGWDPAFAEPHGTSEQIAEAESNARFLKSEGAWFANAVMVTLAALGFIERGKGVGSKPGHCFRLSPLGRAVFGAPEVEYSPPSASKFLVVQPNFDVVAYLDKVDAEGFGQLTLLLENSKPTLGPVQTGRITHAAFYRALELGVSYETIVSQLEQSSQHAIPANVKQTLEDWAARRESLSVHTNVNLIAFPDTASRDAYLAKVGGKPCGERWIITEAEPVVGDKAIANAASIDHRMGRQTLIVDEQGYVTSTKPHTTVEIARLQMFSEQADSRWRITSTSVKQALQRGLPASRIKRWLDYMTAEPLPAFLGRAVEAWLGKIPPLQLGSAIVFGVPDPELFTIISQSEQFTPLLLGTLGAGWFLVRPESVKTLEKLLGEYGFDTVAQHTPEPFTATQDRKRRR
ncbi:hypothetical protein BH10PLA2_BH10PLA2_16680 [soil metagenome]